MTTPAKIKCASCGKAIDPVVWSMCQLPSHCYHCGAEMPLTLFKQLGKAAST